MSYEETMEPISFFLLPLASFFISLLAFFSGFGLTTLLLPFFLIFLPLPIAVSATALIHLTNNLFKALLVWRQCDWKIVWKFGCISWIFSILGAYLLTRLLFFAPLFTYSLGFKEAQITWTGLLIGFILLISVLLEFLQKKPLGSMVAKHLAVGGALSGFFGGLSGNQGVIRSAFLIQLNLMPESFIATGVFCSLIVDISRTIVYGLNFFPEFYTIAFNGWLIGSLLAAFLGSLCGLYLLPKMTIQGMKQLVSVLVILFALLIMAGIF